MKRNIRTVLCLAAVTAIAMMSTEVGAANSKVTTEDINKRTCADWENGRRNGTSANDQLSALTMVSFVYLKYAQQNIPAKGPRDQDTIFRTLDSTCAGQPATSLFQAVQQMISIDCDHATGAYKTLCETSNKR